MKPAGTTPPALPHLGAVPVSDFWVLPVLFGIVLAALYSFRKAARRVREQRAAREVPAAYATPTPEHPSAPTTATKASIPHVTTRPNTAGGTAYAAEVVDELEDAIEEALEEPAVSDDFYAEEEALLVEEEMQYLGEPERAEDDVG